VAESPREERLSGECRCESAVVLRIVLFVMFPSLPFVSSCLNRVVFIVTWSGEEEGEPREKTRRKGRSHNGEHRREARCKQT
jgi:hypothetical protein